MLLVLAALQKVCYNFSSPSAEVEGFQEETTPLLAESREQMSPEDTQPKMEKSEDSASPSDAGNLNSDLDPTSFKARSLECGRYLCGVLADFAKRLQKFVMGFYRNFGIQVTLAAMLMTSFYRCNVLSLVYVVLLAGTYIFRHPNGPRALLQLWPFLIGLQILSLIFQYGILLGSASSREYFGQMPVFTRRFFLLGAFDPVELYGDFFIFFFACRYLPYTSEFTGKGDDIRSASYIAALEASDHQDPLLAKNASSAEVWPALRFYILLAADKLLIVFVFLCGTFESTLLGVGYVYFSFFTLYREDCYFGNISRCISTWRNFHLYNYAVLVITIMYQLPFIPAATANHIFSWDSVIGVQHLLVSAASNSEKVSHEIWSSWTTMDSIVIFFLVDLMNRLLQSKSFDDIIQHYQRNRRQAAYKGVVSAAVQRRRRKEKVTQILELKAALKRKFRSIFRMVEQTHFMDQEVWCTQKPLDWVDHDEDASEHSDDSSDQDEHLPPTKGDVLEADVVGTSSFFSNISGTMRDLFVSNIDVTIWMTFTTDAETEKIIVDSAVPQPKLEDLSFLSLLFMMLTSNTQWICATVYILALLHDASVLGMIVPAGIFLYGLIQYPRASRELWLFAFFYTAMVILLKYIFQLDLFCVTTSHTFSLQPSPFCQITANGDYTEDASHYHRNDLFGLFKVGEMGFFHYSKWDLLCLLCIVWHRQTLRSRGLWNRDETELGDPFLVEFQDKEERRRRAALNIKDHPYSDSDGMEYDAKGDKDSDGMEYDAKGDIEAPTEEPELFSGPEDDTSEAAFEYECPSVHWYNRLYDMLMPSFFKNFFFQITPSYSETIYEVKPGADVYIVCFLLELIASIYIVLFYAEMASPLQSDLSFSIQANYFSGSMVLTLFIQIMLIILDRVAYVYSSIRMKLLLLYVSVVLFLGYTLFVCPIKSERSFTDNVYIQVFFVLKCLYFIASAYQIRTGFSPVEVSGLSVMTKKASITRGYVFQAYRAIPFVFELKNLLDWMLTPSSLDVWETFKLEDIYANLFLTQCEILYWRHHVRGEPQPLYRKFSSGCVIFCVLLLIIFGPLLLFSSANPNTTLNNVQGARFSLSLIDSSRAEYNILTISSIRNMSEVSTEMYLQMSHEKMVDDNDEREACQRLEMLSYPDDEWIISPPKLQVLIYSLQQAANESAAEEFKWKLTYHFHRPGPPGANDVSGENGVTLSPEALQELATVLGGGNKSETTLHIPNLIPTHFRLTPTSDPIVLHPKDGKYSGVVLTLKRRSDDTWWELHADGPSHSRQNLVVYTVSTLIWNTPINLSKTGYSVIGLYIAGVWSVGQFLRLLFSGMHNKIIYTDMQDVTYLIMICEGIYIARHNKKMALEEQLYRKLIKIFRTPDLLIKLTRRRD